MIIRKILDWLIFSLVYLCLVINLSIIVRKKTEITTKVFDQVEEMTKPLTLMLTLPKSKNKMHNLISNRTLAETNTIIVKKYIIIAINTLIKSQKTSFSPGNLFVSVSSW